LPQDRHPEKKNVPVGTQVEETNKKFEFGRQTPKYKKEEREKGSSFRQSVLTGGGKGHLLSLPSGCTSKQ